MITIRIKARAERRAAPKPAGDRPTYASDEGLS
jgi:hypothetical protein